MEFTTHHNTQRTRSPAAITSHRHAVERCFRSHAAECVAFVKIKRTVRTKTVGFVPEQFVLIKVQSIPVHCNERGRVAFGALFKHARFS